MFWVFFFPTISVILVTLFNSTSTIANGSFPSYLRGGDRRALSLFLNVYVFCSLFLDFYLKKIICQFSIFREYINFMKLTFFLKSS